MAELPSLDLLVQRVERLLQRLDELQSTNAAQAQTILALTQERDALRQRLSSARVQLDQLIDQLPDAEATPADPPREDTHEAA